MVGFANQLGGRVIQEPGGRRIDKDKAVLRVLDIELIRQRVQQGIHPVAGAGQKHRKRIHAHWNRFRKTGKPS